ncbi:hypothetical protein GCM10010383_10260 [Streptomyces lomondensis]|uniref:Uncharacterized protein n=1 Tax=Streptomyces lomondensis TaxID=68229 RepID=A0ABQ2WXL9_9ACTN|nr:hypothetical protein GCM10010383_10260 [Streptomyces lomondensis]
MQRRACLDCRDADVIARKWRGTCDEGDDSAPQYKVTCNNKVIGAAWFRSEVPDPQPIDMPSPLDMHSHGTHIGTTIATPCGPGRSARARPSMPRSLPSPGRSPPGTAPN